jgi:hypothetical protein
VKLVPLTMRLTVAGNALTDEGLMLQLLAPKVRAHDRLTVPLKPSWEETVMGPLLPVLPSFTLGKGLGSLRMKSGLVVTVMVNEALRGAGAPEVVASKVTV